MNKKPVVIAIALLAILGSVIWLYLNRPGRPPRIAMDSYQALGEVAAEATSRLLNHKGQIVVVARENRDGANPVEAAQLQAFTSALKKEGKISIAAVETFRLTPMEQMAAGGRVPRQRFVQVLKSHPKLDAVALFAGFPELDQTDLDQLKQSGARIVVISGYRPEYKRLLAAGWLQIAIVPRFDSPPENAKPPQTLREWFDRDYVIVTTNDTSRLR